MESFSLIGSCGIEIRFVEVTVDARCRLGDHDGAGDLAFVCPSVKLVHSQIRDS